MCAENVKMKSRKLAIVTISVLLLAAASTVSATPSVITEDVFAKSGRYGTGDTTSQAASVNNECLNPILDSNTIDNMVDVGNCGGTVSQQDQSGQASAPITLQNANPTIELQRATTTQPPLTEPFGTALKAQLLTSLSEFLTPDEIAALKAQLEAGNLEGACAILEGLPPGTPIALLFIAAALIFLPSILPVDGPICQGT
jgi:hypothetical protein